MKIKIRIAVAVAPNGEWNSSGWGRPEKEVSDKDKMDIAVEPLDSGEAQYFIEAEVDVPKETTIQGTVIK